ncbi:MAG: TonB-dependent receptor [Bacteroidota bacterium]
MRPFTMRPFPTLGSLLLVGGLAVLSVLPARAQPTPPDQEPDTTQTLQPLTARTVAEVAGWQPGVARLLSSGDLASEDLLVRGRRLTTAYLDGLPVPVTGLQGLPALPQAHLAGVRVYTDVAPVRYGGATAGLLEVTTPTLVAAPYALGEAHTSQALDAYGHTLAALAAGAPLLRDRDGRPRLAVTLAAEVRRYDDGDPRAGDFVQLTDATQERLGDAVQVAFGFDASGEGGLVPIPDGFEGRSQSELAALGGVNNPRPAEAVRTLVSDDLERVAANPLGASEALWLSGGLHAQPTPTTTLRLRGQLVQDERRVADYLRTLYNGASIQQRDTDSWRLHASLDQQVGERLGVHAAFATERATATTYDPRFGTEVSQALFYGDIDDPRNATGARYLSLVNDTLVQRFADGAISPGAVGERVLSPGATTSTYEHAEQQQQSLRLAATLGLDRHRIEVGVEGVWQTLRLYRWNDASSLARFFDDGRVERGAENGISAYDQLDYDLANVAFLTRYFGYDYLGLNEADDSNLDALFAGTDPAHAVAPLQPRRYGFYAEDTFTYGRLSVRAGLRLDAFDANGVQLFDAFATQPIIRASALASGDVLDEAGGLLVRAPDALPAGVGDDFAVYTDNSGTVVGYRDRDGVFYDAEGLRVEDSGTITFERGGRVTEDATASPGSILTDTDIVTALSPRIEARLSAAPGLTVRAFFARYAEASDPTRGASAGDLRRLGAAARTDVDPVAYQPLRPIRSQALGVGATAEGVRGSTWLRGSATLFHRRYWDVPVARLVDRAFPVSYTTLANSDEVVSLFGAEVTLSAKRGRLRGDLHYTIQQAPELDGVTVFILGTRGALFPEALDLYSVLQAEDRPHNFQLLAEYRVDPEDSAFGQRWLGGVRAAVAVRALSGQPFVRLSSDEIGTVVTGGNEGSSALGSAPVLLSADLWLEKAFQVGRVEASAYLWVENVFNRANVVGVYPTTGEPDDNGFLASPDGQQVLNNFATDLERESFIAHYEAGVQTPYNYGRPRQVRIGVRVGF